MRFATITMLLVIALFTGMAFLAPEPRLPGVPTESEFARERSADAVNATSPGLHESLFMLTYYAALVAFAGTASFLAVRLLFRRHRGGRARAILIACLFPLLLGLCA